MQRSNSSAPLRCKLKERSAYVPEISEKVSLLKYIQLAKNIYNGALSACKQGDLRRAYVDLYRFQLLVLDRIPKHKEYNLASKVILENKKWLEKVTAPALKILEQIVHELDDEEDRRCLYQSDIQLIDEFDCDEESVHVNSVTPKESKQITESISYKKDLARLSVLKSNVDIFPQIQSDIISYSTCSVPDLSYPSDPFGNSESILPNIKEMPSLCLSSDEINIIKHLGDYRRFDIPLPSTSTVQMRINNDILYDFYQDDFHVSYAGFLQQLPIELQLSKAAVESNRCFFIHLGIAMQIHPFALQSAFRILATRFLEELNIDKKKYQHNATVAGSVPEQEEGGSCCWKSDIISTVHQYCGFVDANALCWIWPEEFDLHKICFISGPLSKPLISCFMPPSPPTPFLSYSSTTSLSLSTPRTVNSNNNVLSQHTYRPLTEIIIRCNGDHFTLLRPIRANNNNGTNTITNNGGFEILDKLLEDARAANLVVQINEVDYKSIRANGKELSVNSALSSLIYKT